jgi:ADP-ribosylglycohydrolase
MSPDRKPPDHPVVGSALWAAWGDALGFITELTTSLSEVTRRSGGAKVENTVRWKRRLGGRFGPMVELPAGAYSDDTQLRLAVSRSIRADGRFDLEAFSKIELPVFLSYEMRAGKGTKAAAFELMKRHVRWSSNFFDNERARYVNAGGNGAAMRIQPHVWSAPGYNPKHFIRPVTMDAIVTHGHPRGVIGAVIHANALSSVLRHGSIPGPDLWEQIVEYARGVTTVMRDDEVLRERWLPEWEKAAGTSWADAVAETVVEGRKMIAAAKHAAEADDAAMAYRDLVIAIGGKTRETVGSGMIAAIASLFAAWVFRDNPVHGLVVVANHLGTDTDTIATMAGALIGATGASDVPGPVLDRDYIAAEAMRMVAIGSGDDARSFPHPDPIKWRPPRALADAVGAIDGRLVVAGLGTVSETGEEYPLDQKDGASYQWMHLEFGQSVLIKRRREPKPVMTGSLPVERPVRPATRGHSAQAPLFEVRSKQPDGAAARPTDDLAEAVQRVAKTDFDPDVIGTELLRLSELPHQSIELSAAFAVAVTTLRRSRAAERNPGESNGARE